MPVDVILPKVDMDMQSAIIESWKVKAGQTVAKGDVLFDIITNKAAMEIDAPASGIIAAINGPIGEPIPVGAVVARIFRAGEEVVDRPVPWPESQRAVGVDALAARVANENAPMAMASGERRATPFARKIARDFSVSLAEVAGSGPRGRISARDVRDAAQANLSGVTKHKPGRLVPFDPVQRIAAMRLAASIKSAPHFFLTAEIDMGDALAALDRARADALAASSERPSLTILIATLVARVLKQHPRLNASVEDHAMRLHDQVDLAIAVDKDGALIAPVLRDAGQRSLAELTATFADLTRRARQRALKPAEMSGGTFTLSNLGMYGVDAFTAIINPPQSAILAIGRIEERPVGRDGQVVLRPMATFSLSSDHRVIDGVTAARFMADLRAALAAPASIL